MVVCRLFLLFLIQMIFQPCWNKPQSATMEMTPLSLHEKEAIVNSHVEFLKHIFNHFRQTDYLYRWNMENKDNLLIQAAKNTTKDEDAVLEERLQVIETKPRDLTSNTTKDKDAALEERSQGIGTKLRDLTSNAIGECTGDYHFFEEINWCIKITNTSQYWKEALESCAAEGGTLAIVDTKEKQAALSDLMKQRNVEYLWIGLSDTLNRLKFVWNDGTPVTFTSWRIGLPKEVSYYNCVFSSRLLNYDWLTHRCDQNFNYACEKRNKKPAVCPQGYTYFEEINWCVKPSTTKRSWDEVSEACATESGTFAVVNTTEKHEAISEMKLNIWIGLSNTLDKEKFAWTDGTPVSFTSWGKGEPDNGRSYKNCVRYSSSLDNKWESDRCSNHLPFLCEMIMT